MENNVARSITYFICTLLKKKRNWIHYTHYPISFSIKILMVFVYALLSTVHVRSKAYHYKIGMCADYNIFHFVAVGKSSVSL